MPTPQRSYRSDLVACTEQRSKNMSRIRSKDTKPEMIVRRFLWSNGYRYRLNHPRLPGKPDIVLRKYRTCIFVNGCFWHGHNSPHLTSPGGGITLDSSDCCKIPHTNRGFWVAKILRNQQRDIEVQKELAGMGWHCITIWECQLSNKRVQSSLLELPSAEESQDAQQINLSPKTLRERTLESLEYTLNKIYLQDHSLKRYELPEVESQIAAEDIGGYDIQ